MRRTLEVASPEHMQALGVALGRAARESDVFLLEGPFGAGKTTLVQGLARGLDIATPISSPSFVIETQHRGRLLLYHVDLYRLERVEQELLQSLEEHLFSDGVTAVEWAERLPAELREGAHVLELSVCDAGRLVRLDTDEERLLRAFESA